MPYVFQCCFMALFYVARNQRIFAVEGLVAAPVLCVMPAVSLQQHIVAVGKYLNAVPHAQRKGACRSQLNILIEIAKRKSKRTARDWTDASLALADLPFSDDEISQLTDIFNQKMAELGNETSQAAINRRDQQDWINFWIGLPADFVDSLLKLRAQLGLERLLAWLHDKGLRLPSEPTFGGITAVYLLLFEDPFDKSAQYKLATVQHVKDKWESFDKFAPVTTWHLTWDTQAILEPGISVWETDAIEMSMLIKSIPLRKTHRLTSKSSAPTLKLGNEGCLPSDGLMGMANCFAASLQQMQKMQQMQMQQMMQMINGNTAGDEFMALGDKAASGSGSVLMLGDTDRSKRPCANARLSKLKDAMSGKLRAREVGHPASDEDVESFDRKHALLSSGRSRSGHTVAEFKPSDAEPSPDAPSTRGPDLALVLHPDHAPKDIALVSAGEPTKDSKRKMSLAEATALLMKQADERTGESKAIKKQKLADATAATSASPASAPRGKGSGVRKSKEPPAPKAEASKASAAPKQSAAPKKLPKAEASKASAAPKQSAAPKKLPKDHRAKVKFFKQNGCSKCRWKVGCTPSCWSARGMEMPPRTP